MFFPLLLLLMFLALVAQHFVGAFPGLGGQILLLPVVFFYAAAALPLWATLVSAFVAGLMWECLVNIPVDGKHEIIFGWTILVYGGLGAVMNGLHPLFIRGRWGLHCVLTGVLVSLLTLIEYVVLTFRREPFAFVWPPHVWRQILGSGFAALLISPPLFLSLNWIGRRLGHFDRARHAATTE